MTYTEKEILELIAEYELEPTMIDVWADADENLLIEERGMKPVDGTELVAHVDNGIVFFK